MSNNNPFQTPSDTDEALNPNPFNDDIHVVVSERDLEIGGRPIAFETHTDSATLEQARKRQKNLGDRYGETRIAKLVFIDPNADLLDASKEIMKWFGSLDDWCGVGDPPLKKLQLAIIAAENAIEKLPS